MIPVQHIHPMLVHFPIVLIYVLVVIDFLAMSRQQQLTTRGGVATVSTFTAIGAGLLALATWYFGGLALDIAESGGFRSDIAEIHEGLGGATAAAFAAWGLVRLALWLRNRPLGKIRLSIPLIEALGAGLVTVTAYYGGKLVYDLGVNVQAAIAG